MKKIMPLVASIVLILVAGMFAGAGTIAYFSDTDVAGTPRFKAKILDIKVHSFTLPVDFAPGDGRTNDIYIEVPSYSMKPDHIEFRIWADLSTFYDWPGESGGSNNPRLLLRYINVWGRWFNPNLHEAFYWYNYHERVGCQTESMEEGLDPTTHTYWLWASPDDVPEPGSQGRLKLTISFDPDAPNALQGDRIVLHLDVAADQVADQNVLNRAP